jgi:predicted nucleic acid-binding Zn ribbon protein
VRFVKLRFDLADDFYRRTIATLGRKSRDQARREEKSKRGSQPFERGREPISAAEGIENLLEDFDWLGKVQEEALVLDWEKLVGIENAAASKPVGLTGNLLTIQCRSTAWATQLRLLQDQILARVQEQYPDLAIKELRFLGPAAPSWKKGPRSVPGRGPRDTYG